ncbi:hypothetical protein [Nannocystis pusilla]|uniref:hypothetical protein n=1 Tax=Nannocystis pusilla TaxID=889268 RepID=UPI003B7CB319
MLADPALRAAELRWRALRLFLGQCPRDQDLDVELLDVDAARLPAALAELAELDPLARPDAIFLLDPLTSLADAAVLAEVAADLHAPVCAELAPAALGRADTATLAGQDLGDEFAALRDDPASRWLALAVNGPVLAAETTPAGERVVAGGPPWPSPPCWPPACASAAPSPSSAATPTCGRRRPGRSNTARRTSRSAPPRRAPPTTSWPSRARASSPSPARSRAIS